MFKKFTLIKKLLISLTITVTIMSHSALANTGVWVNSLTVDKILSRQDGGLAFTTSPTFVTPQGQCNTATVYMSPGTNGVTAEGVKSAMAILLTALSTGKEISIYVLNGIDTCWAQEIWIYK